MRKLYLISILLLAASISMSARSFVRSITADGAATLTVFLPDEGCTGRTIVACPGGGYANLMMDYEGTDWADYFNQKGIAYCVLKYRMPHGDRNIPISDAYAAMKMVRDSADVWQINRNDVGIMGFSAGGHLAATVSTHAPMQLRPDFSILFYPVITMQYKQTHHGSVDNFLGTDKDNADIVKDFSNDQAVRKHLTPPSVVFLANDDDIVPILQNGVAYFTAQNKVGNSSALYCYPSGGHGFGFKANFKYHDQMLRDLDNWLADIPSPNRKAIREACIGNSITDGSGIFMRDLFGYPAQLQKKLGSGYYVKNFGVGARTMLNHGDYPYMNEQAWRDALGFQPDIAIIKLGTNDSKPKNCKYSQEFRHDMQQMIDSLKALPSHPQIYLATPIPACSELGTILEPVIANEICPIIKEKAKENKCHLIDLHTLYKPTEGILQKDGIHPTTKGAGYLADIIRENITANLPVPPGTSGISDYLNKAQLTRIATFQSDSARAYQGMAIYGNYLVSVQNKGIATIYQLPEMKKVSPTFPLGSFADYNHANVAAFGVEKYKKKDPMPVLYVSQAYKKPVNGKKDLCYVERLNLDGSSETVQTIMLDDETHLYGYALQWTVDAKNRRLIGFGNTQNNNAPDNELRIIIFPLPKLSEGKEVHLKASDAIDCYTLQQFDPRYPHQVVGQGACVQDDYLIMPTGFGEKDAPSIIYVWDLNKKTLVDAIDLRGKLDHEMEDADFYNGELYIQTNGAGLVKLKK